MDAEFQVRAYEELAASEGRTLVEPDVAVKVLSRIRELHNGEELQKAFESMEVIRDYVEEIECELEALEEE